MATERSFHAEGQKHMDSGHGGVPHGRKYQVVGGVSVSVPVPSHNYSLEPGTVYAHLDDAMHAASCLCHLNPNGATVYGTTSGPDVSPVSEEAYRVAIDVTRPDGSTWPVPSLPYEPVYTITRARR